MASCTMLLAAKKSKMTKEEVAEWKAEELKKRKRAKQRLYRMKKKVEGVEKEKVLNSSVKKIAVKEIVDKSVNVSSTDSTIIKYSESLVDIKIEDLCFDIKYSTVVETFSRIGKDAEATKDVFFNLSDDNDHSSLEPERCESSMQGTSVKKTLDTFKFDPLLAIEWVSTVESVLSCCGGDVGTVVADVLNLEAYDIEK